MTLHDVKRKLTAILSADVKGYSRLMGKDEAGTVHTLTAHKETMTVRIREHHGRVVDAPGDNLLAEFASVVDAVQCAVEIQRELKERNDKLPPDQRMEFRIGINLGDVVEQDERIFGDGVNIAARLESLSEPRGICISGTVYDQVKDKLPLRYEYRGKQTVKNIAEPLRVYRVLTEPASRISTLKRKGFTSWKRVHPAFKILIALVIVVAAVWPLTTHYLGRPLASKEKLALPLPDVPSIFVLPFSNMSEDPKQEFLTDGITSSIITALFKVPGVFVIGGLSTFSYKGRPAKVKKVSEEFGVRYVLEGSVQRSADRIRINAQLIDALTGHPLWAERYDRELKDIFALQDEITMKILTATQVTLTEEGEEALSAARYYQGERGLDCYLKYFEGTGYLRRRTVEDDNVARRIAGEAIAMCPESPMGYYLLASAYQQDCLLAIPEPPREKIEKGIDLARKMLALDDSLAEGHALLCGFYFMKGEHEKAIAEGQRALDLNPRLPVANSWYAVSLYFAGRPEEAVPFFQKVIRLCPVSGFTICIPFGNALRDTGRYEEAVLEYKKAIQRSPDDVGAHAFLAGTYSLMDRQKEAHAEAAEVLRINPRFSLDSFAKHDPFRGQPQEEKLFNALRKAGLT